MDENIRKYLSEKYKDQMAQPELPAVDKYNQDFSDEKFKETQAQADEKQSGLGWAQLAGGIGDALAGRDSSKTAANFEGIRKGIKDDTIGAFEKRKSNAINDIKTKKTLETGDANSERSMAFRKIIESKFPDVAKAYGDNWGNVTADDQDTIFKPLQLKEQIEARNQQARILAGDRAASRAQKEEENAFKREEKLKKDNELSSTQAKQLGLYKSGMAAEKQYNLAIGDKKEYDPTSGGQWIDNSEWAPNSWKNKKAVETQAAESAWIESFLRDASGAAIPPNERGAYAKDFFAQPGDTPKVVANKNALRKQKMENALIGAGPGGQQFANELDTSKTVRIKDPKTGKIHTIPADQAQAAVIGGGQLVDNIARQ